MITNGHAETNLTEKINMQMIWIENGLKLVQKRKLSKAARCFAAADRTDDRKRNN